MSVVNAYAATSDSVVVILDNKEDLPTDGKPIKATRASPDFVTSNPSPGLPPLEVGSSSCACR